MSRQRDLSPCSLLCHLPLRDSPWPVDSGPEAGNAADPVREPQAAHSLACGPGPLSWTRGGVALTQKQIFALYQDSASVLYSGH